MYPRESINKEKNVFFPIVPKMRDQHSEKTRMRVLGFELPTTCSN